jgi:hypothetical protein
MSETITTMGKILPADHQQGRDAIHIAVMPVVASCTMRPGEPVSLQGYASDEAVYDNSDNYLGIVDPFLAVSVQKGQKFWLFLRPGTISGLRHEWTHPMIKPQSANEPPAVVDEMEDHEAWLRDFASRWSMSYHDMIAAAKEGTYTTAGGMDFGKYDLGPGEENLFWTHMEGLTGLKFDDNHKENFGWSCSC